MRDIARMREELFMVVRTQRRGRLGYNASLLKLTALKV